MCSESIISSAAYARHANNRDKDSTDMDVEIVRGSDGSDSNNNSRYSACQPRLGACGVCFPSVLLHTQLADWTHGRMGQAESWQAPLRPLVAKGPPGAVG